MFHRFGQSAVCHDIYASLQSSCNRMGRCRYLSSASDQPCLLDHADRLWPDRSNEVLILCMQLDWSDTGDLALAEI